jgi:hypothetical protein
MVMPHTTVPGSIYALNLDGLAIMGSAHLAQLESEEIGMVV